RQIRPLPNARREFRSVDPDAGVFFLGVGGVLDSWTQGPPMPMASAFTPSNASGRSWTVVDGSAADAPSSTGFCLHLACRRFYNRTNVRTPYEMTGGTPECCRWSTTTS